jgi:hypothetical protein
MYKYRRLIYHASIYRHDVSQLDESSSMYDGGILRKSNNDGAIDGVIDQWAI